MQTAQAVVKHAGTDFSNWLKSLKGLQAGSVKVLGKPQMPHYRSVIVSHFGITNQDAVLYPADHGVNLKLPGEKGTPLSFKCRNGFRPQS